MACWSVPPVLPVVSTTLAALLTSVRGSAVCPAVPRDKLQLLVALSSKLLVWMSEPNHGVLFRPWHECCMTRGSWGMKRTNLFQWQDQLNVLLLQNLQPADLEQSSLGIPWQTERETSACIAWDVRHSCTQNWRWVWRSDSTNKEQQTWQTHWVC